MKDNNCPENVILILSCIKTIDDTNKQSFCRLFLISSVKKHSPSQLSWIGDAVVPMPDVLFDQSSFRTSSSKVNFLKAVADSLRCYCTAMYTTLYSCCRGSYFSPIPQMVKGVVSVLTAGCNTWPWPSRQIKNSSGFVKFCPELSDCCELPMENTCNL